MEKQKPSLPEVTRFINGLEKRPEYLDAISGGDRFHALGRVASIYASRMEDAKPKDKSELLTLMSVGVMSTLPGFLNGSRELSHLYELEATGTRVKRSEKVPHLEAVIPFNHRLRDLIDMFPEFSFEQVQNYCSQMALFMSGPADAAYCKQVVREQLVGMRTEIGMSQILWKIDGVEDVIPAETAEQEMRGIDLVVTYHGKPLMLDAKASETGVQKALAKRTTISADTSGYPVYPQIAYEDFGGGFRISDETAERLAPRLEAVLDDIYRQTYRSVAM